MVRWAYRIRDTVLFGRPFAVFSCSSLVFDPFVFTVALVTSHSGSLPPLPLAQREKGKSGCARHRRSASACIRMNGFCSTTVYMKYNRDFGKYMHEQPDIAKNSERFSSTSVSAQLEFLWFKLLFRSRTAQTAMTAYEEFLGISEGVDGGSSNVLIWSFDLGICMVIGSWVLCDKEVNIGISSRFFQALTLRRHHCVHSYRAASLRPFRPVIMSSFKR